MNRLAARGRTLVGFNSEHFDVPVVRAILGGFDPYAFCQAIIGEKPLPVPLSKLPPFPCDTIDLCARLRRGGRFPGLKAVAANLGRPRLRELPYAPGSILDDDQWAEVKRYNEVDLQHTRAVLETFAPELQALALLSTEQGRDLRSTPTPRVVERIFLDGFGRKNGGREPVKPETPHEVMYRPPEGVRRPRTPDAATWFDLVTGSPLPVVTRGGNPKVEVPRASFTIGKLTLSVGAGGIHSVDRPRLYYATKTHALVSVDVASYYPNLIAANGIVPRSYGDVGAETYRGLLARRLKTKALAKAEADPAERERLDVQATALKLVLNSTFGKYGDPYSSLFDPEAMIRVTVTGQLMLIDLVERMHKAGARVLSVNTDGLFLRVRRDNQRWRKALARWEADTAMALEVEPLRRFLTLATNRYATLGTDGKVKRRGDGLKGSLSPFNPANGLIVADAVAEALLRDVPPERTVWGCTDPVRFCRITRRTKKVVSAAVVDEVNGSESELPRITRWYKARNSARKIVHRFEGGRHTTPSQATGIAVALDVVNGEVPDDVDRSWYISQARKVIQAVPGYRHRSRRHLGDHAPALEALALGLAPCPKRGKAQPAGSDATHPNYLYDWPRYPTVGTYTGPEVALLVLDVDKADLFRLWVSKGNSPLLADRWDDLEGCLVSVRGDATADEVRTGRARGKLIFRFEADAAHPLAKVAPGYWQKGRGIDLFYGRGIPSVLGAHPDGGAYRLEGELGPPPQWLIEGLTPKSKPGGAAPDRADAVPREVTEEVRDALLVELAELAPELGRASVGWRTKELADGRRLWVGRCPFEHESGRSEDGDIAAGFNAEGMPYVRCQHTSCTSSRDVDARLKGRHANAEPQTEATGDAPEMVPTTIAETISADLTSRFVSLHLAPTGSGKSYSVAQAAALLYRQGKAVLIAVPTLRLAEETWDRLTVMAPDAFAVDAVARIYGGAKLSVEDEGAGEADEDSEGDEVAGAYPVHEDTRIIVATHEQLGRRGFSKFVRGIYTKLVLDEGGDARDGHPPFAIIIDEVAELIRASRREFDLAHRTGRKGEPDGSGGAYVPREKCPKFTRSGNCANCRLVGHGGVTRFNNFGIREMKRPPVIEIDEHNEPLRRAREPLKLHEGDLTLGTKVRVGHTTFAAQVLESWGKPTDDSTRRTANLFLFTKEKGDDGVQQAESKREVLAHMMEFAYRPLITWEHPINEEGEVIESGTLALRIGQGGKRKWDEGVVFPMATCEVPRLRFTDLAVLEQLRRHAAKEKVGIVLTGATLGPDDAEVLRVVWPRIVERSHPYPDRKIKQVAIVAPEGYRGADCLVGPDGRLVTAPLEEHGKGLVFCATKRLAESLYNAVAGQQPTAWLAAENYEQMFYRKTLHHPGDLTTYVTYSRGVLGLGANVEHIRHLVVDAHAFRSVASFTPGEVTPAEFERQRSRERLSLILQNLGRALRGEEGKTVVLVVLNADAELLAAVRASAGIVEGSELPPVVATGRDLFPLLNQAGRWLAANGGDWPESDPSKAGPKAGRPKGTKTKSKEDIFRAADEAVAAGMKWREFDRRYHPGRDLGQHDLGECKARFSKERVSPKIPPESENEC